MTWTKIQPTEPGWYWCRNLNEHGQTWEGVVRIERVAGELCCCWLIGPFLSGIKSKIEWREESLWSPKLKPPTVEN